MLGHFRAAGIKQALIETISALGRLAVATVPVDFAVKVFNLVRIQNHDLGFVRANRKGFRRVPGLRKSPGSTARRGWGYQSVIRLEVGMNLRYAGIIGETRGESQHTAWTANCPKTGQKRQIKGCEKACFTAWSKGTAYTRDTFFTREKCVVPRARIMRPCPRARTRTREKSVGLPVLGKWPKDGQRTWSDCGQSAWTAFRASARRLYLQVLQLAPAVGLGVVSAGCADWLSSVPRSQSADTPQSAMIVQMVLMSGSLIPLSQEE